MVTRSLGAIVVREPVTSMAGKEDEMSPASKVTAAKKVPASRPPAVKKAAPTKKSAPVKAASAAKTVTPKKNVPPTKKAVPTKNAQAAKKPAPPPKSGGSVNKETTVTKKSPPPAKKAAGPSKKAVAPPKPVGAAAPNASTPAVDPGAAEIVEAPPPVRSTFTPKPKPPPPVRPKTGPYAKDLKFLEEITQLLAEERVIYQEQATSLRAEADSLALEREPGDVQFDEESGEGGTVTVDRERNLALSGQAALAVEEIDYASERIADKTYGYCERCFQPIPKPRLRALPYARLCVACKSGGLSRR
jgi:DnaK suppressor protein